MADLQFVDFALMLGPVWKEKQFELPGDFCKIDVIIPLCYVFDMFYHGFY